MLEVGVKKTRWFKGEIKPVRKGWYEVRCEHGFYDRGQRLYWNGKSWAFIARDSGNSGSTFGNRCDRWRGLAENPNGN